jgi:hypothetical protein
MKARARTIFAGLTAVGLPLCGAAAAMADPAILTNGQLDLVTAGGTPTIVGAISDAGASGLVTLTNTATNAIVVGSPSQFAGQPNIGPTGGAAEGTAYAVGTNLGQDGPPTQATTNVQTGGATLFPQGGTTVNYTVHGAGGVQIQVGWTFIQGGWNGL